jgi:hypothetical protein
MEITRHIRDAHAAAADRWKNSKPYDRTIFAIAAVYILVTGGVMVWHRNLLSPDQFFVLTFLVSALMGRARPFLRDWLPLVILLLGYDYVRGLVPIVNSHVYLRPMIDFDRFVFGSVPTIALQAKFYVADSPHWYDYAAVILYFLHFVVPLGAAFLFWLQDRRMFREYAAGLLVLSYLAYFTYLIFPAAPPWLAAQAGLLPEVHRILANTLLQFRDPISLPTIYSKIGVNMVAAVPSLHAAYPLLTALFVGEKLPKLIPLLVVYVFSVWMAVIYLGEHYAFDVFTGVIYAVAAYLLVVYWPRIKSMFARSKAPVEQASPVS